MKKYPSTGGGTIRLDNTQIFSNTTASDIPIFDGGAVYIADGELIIENSHFAHNNAIDDGGAIYARDTTVIISGTTFYSNTTTTGSAILALDGGTLTLDNSQFIDNHVANVGGAIYQINNAVSTIHTSTFQSNISSSGGAIYCSNGSLTLLDSQLHNNRAGNDAGAINGNDCQLHLTNSTVIGNRSQSSGGALYMGGDGGELITISHTVFEDNHALNNEGGAAYLGSSSGYTIVLSDLTIGNNSAGGYGGGLYLDRVTTLTLRDLTITGNESGRNTGNVTYGGGIYLYAGETAVLERLRIQDNYASGDGGGLYVNDASNDETVSIEQVALIDNEAGRHGGGLYNEFSGISITNSTISGNQAGEHGGGLYNENNNEQIELVNVTIAANQAITAGNSIYSTGDLWLSNTILAGGDNCAGTMPASNGYNLIDDASCSLSASGDITNSNALLAPLADNRLPNTAGLTLPSHDLLSGSPAVDAGDCAGGMVSSDQRDLPRPRAGGCDIGAIERALLTAVADDYTTPQDTALIVLDSGAGTRIPAPQTFTADWLRRTYPLPATLTHEQLENGRLAAISGIAGNDLIDVETAEITLIAQPPHGAIGLNIDGTFVYAPNASFVGADLFYYTLVDSYFTDTADVLILVTNSSCGNVTPQANAVSANWNGTDLALTWSDPATNVGGYNLYTAVGPYTSVDELLRRFPAQATNYTVNAAAPIYYQVRGYNCDRSQFADGERIGFFTFTLSPGG